MSNGSFALPDRFVAGSPSGRTAARRTPSSERWRRLGGLIVQLLRMWLAALAIAPRLDAAGRRRFIYGSAARVLAVLGVDVRIRGEVPPGGRPVLLVANHVSWLDTYAIHTVNAARFVAKLEVGTWPVIGTVARRFGTFFIKRGCFRSAARMVGTLVEALCAGQAVAAFPEATTSDGSRLLRFHPAMFQAAVRSGCRVQPVAIRYRDASGVPSAAAAFVGDMTIAESLQRIVREPRLTVELVFCPPIDPAGRTRKELATLARHAIAVALGLERETPHERRRAA